ncbi:hypothetical protein [Pirellulimonas nuda]|uniref:hypothetical protein n=1 Tax=Pirellulimonas nuda TaxID=2528009 RepID=UPI0011A1AF1D|nr:hypothetical protein [Pirellulimonas nuda]
MLLLASVLLVFLSTLGWAYAVVYIGLWGFVLGDDRLAQVNTIAVVSASVASLAAAATFAVVARTRDYSVDELVRTVALACTALLVVVGLLWQ